MIIVLTLSQKWCLVYYCFYFSLLCGSVEEQIHADRSALTDKLFYALDDAALHELHYNLLQHFVHFRTILYLLGS